MGLDDSAKPHLKFGSIGRESDVAKCSAITWGSDYTSSSSLFNSLLY
jgi:hypothetical protein